jgi:hypothetical protein
MVMNQQGIESSGGNGDIFSNRSDYRVLDLFTKGSTPNDLRICIGTDTEQSVITNINGSNSIIGLTTNTTTASILINASTALTFTPGTAQPMNVSQPYGFVGSRWIGSMGEVLAYSNVLTPFDRQKVEGYLAWKWGLNAQLPTTHPFKLAAPINTSVFSPSSLTGLQLWLDGADPLATGTAPANGTSITTWADKSGSNNSGTLNGTAPTYLSSEQAVNFSAQNGFYSLPISASSSNESIFFVGTATSAPASVQNVVGASDIGGRNMGIWWDRSALWNGANGVGSYTYTSNGSISLNVKFLAENITSNLTMTAYVNGGSNAFSSAASLTAGRTTQLGGSYVDNTQYYRSVQYINEVIIFNRPLSADDRQTVEGYLAWKWGLQGSLPSTHPYVLKNPGALSTTFSVATSGLQVYLAPDTYSGSGTTWDNIQNSTDATLVNSPSYSAQNGFTFNGTNQYASLPNAPGITDFTISNNYTVESWVYIPPTAATGAIVEKWSGSGGYPYVCRWENSINSVRYAVYNGTANPSLLVPVSTGVWMQLVGVFNHSGTTLSGYRNGSLVSSTTLSITGTINNNDGLYLAARGIGATLFAGSIGIVRIYSRALSATEVLQNFQADRGRYGI